MDPEGQLEKSGTSGGHVTSLSPSLWSLADVRALGDCLLRTVSVMSMLPAYE